MIGVDNNNDGGNGGDDDDEHEHEQNGFQITLNYFELLLTVWKDINK